MYHDLIRLLKRDGYQLPSKLDKSTDYGHWGYIGVNSHGDIILYDQSSDYLPVEGTVKERYFNNTLKKEWLWNYLKQ